MRSLPFNRRSLLRGILGGAGVVVGIPALDIFLDGNGRAWADGAKLPTRFGTYFWGLGLTDTPTGGTRWVPTKTGKGYEVTPELTSLSKVKDKVSVFSGFRVIGDGKPNVVHWTGHASILSGVAPAATNKMDAPSFDTKVADMAGLGAADQQKMDQYFTSLREMENQLAIQLERPEKCESCVVPKSPGEPSRVGSVDIVNANTKAMAKLLAMGMACNQTRVFNFVHTPGSSETYMAGSNKIYHQITHDEPTDAKLGYQIETSKLAGQVMEGLGAFLNELDAIKEGDGTLLDHSLVMAFSDTGYAKIHSIENIPMFLAGGANGRHKAGQHVATKGEPVTRLSLTAMQIAGVPVGEFGTGTMKTSRPLTEVMA